MTTRSPRTTRTAKTAAGKTPFDLDAVEAETAGEPFEFDYRGHTYSLPHVQDVDRKVLLGADQGDISAMNALFREGLGDDFEQFDAQPMKLRSLNKLFEAWLKHCGLEPGELQASTRS
ncbi:hypothetical protein [Nonomuraea sp. GTA35]|uniref:hypothetical protein n=1 Tax=Nonomuraea sp. GTA35 TaxID=1676746 RepID=UPI0035C075A0